MNETGASLEQDDKVTDQLAAEVRGKLDVDRLLASPSMSTEGDRADFRPMEAVVHDQHAPPAYSGMPMSPTASWQGWAELENDPAIFSTLLREWGVHAVAVREVIPLDAIFDSPGDSTYGLIFLSRYVPSTANDTEDPSPEVWFANQTSSFSCASLALLNIINNRIDINLGPVLSDFRNRTWNLSSKDRGLSLDDFEHIRNVHNSFATNFDRMNVDLRLKEDATAAAKKKLPSAKRRRKRKDLMEEERDDNGFHFVAYVPACGKVWRMDGMEAQPQSLGVFENQDNWLATVIPDLQAQWETAAHSQLEFSLLSLVAETDKSGRKEEETKTRRMREDWGPFISHMLKLHAEKGDIRAGLT